MDKEGTKIKRVKIKDKTHKNKERSMKDRARIHKINDKTIKFKEQK
ncbi:20416_t:CDS:1, partial [Rhizophagus irregularis]